jgi:hypothetical protein
MDRFLKGWIKNSLIMQGDSVSSIKANKCFNELLSWVVKENYQGACHDVSIALHVLLSECGLKCNICIGEVKVSEYEYFDHSWVEADGFIYDIAVCAPNFPQYAHPPIYRGQSLSGNIRFVYGMESPEGLDDVTQFVLQSDINQYLEGHPNGVGFIWHLIKKVAKSCNIKLNKAKLREMYGWTKRTFKTA